jgi:hypothetical protein
VTGVVWKDRPGNLRPCRLIADQPGVVGLCGRLREATLDALEVDDLPAERFTLPRIAECVVDGGAGEGQRDPLGLE